MNTEEKRKKNADDFIRGTEYFGYFLALVVITASIVKMLNS